MPSKLIAFRADATMEDALERLRLEHKLKSASQAARLAVVIGLDKLHSVDIAVRQAAFVEGEIEGRAAFKKKLAAFFAQGPEDAE